MKNSKYERMVRAFRYLSDPWRVLYSVRGRSFFADTYNPCLRLPRRWGVLQRLNRLAGTATFGCRAHLDARAARAAMPQLRKEFGCKAARAAIKAFARQITDGGDNLRVITWRDLARVRQYRVQIWS